MSKNFIGNTLKKKGFFFQNFNFFKFHKEKQTDGSSDALLNDLYNEEEKFQDLANVFIQ